MSEEKNNEAIMVRITPRLLARVEAACAKAGLKPATLARMGLVEILERLESLAPVVTPEQSERLRKLEALAELQVDVDGIIDRALQQAGEPLLPTGTG